MYDDTQPTQAWDFDNNAPVEPEDMKIDGANEAQATVPSVSAPQ